MPPAPRTLPSLRISRPSAPRCLALKFTPPLYTLAQSRAVLSSIRSRFGPLESWRDLRHDLQHPRAGVVHALFKTEDSAGRVLASSPLRIALRTNGAEVLSCELHGEDVVEKEPEREVRSLPLPEELVRRDRKDEADDWGTAPVARLLQGLDIKAPPSEGRYSREQRRGFATSRESQRGWTGRPEKESTIEFVIHAERARIDLEAAVRKHPCHGPFEVHVRSAIAASVAARAPLKGLADLTLKRERLGWKEIGRVRRKKGVLGKSLKELYEEGKRAREEKENVAPYEDVKA